MEILFLIVCLFLSFSLALKAYENNNFFDLGFYSVLDAAFACFMWREFHLQHVSLLFLVATCIYTVIDLFFVSFLLLKRKGFVK